MKGAALLRPTPLNLSPPESIHDLEATETHAKWFRTLSLQLLEVDTEKKLNKAVEWFADEMGELKEIPFVVIGHNFYKFFLQNMLGKRNYAWWTLDYLGIILDDVIGDQNISPEAHQALQYLLVCEKAALSYQSDKKDGAEQYLDEMRALFTPDLYSEKAKATFLCIMGQFAGKCDKESRIHLLHEAVQLDPENWQLHLCLYRAFRSYRREFAWETAPYDDEVAACWKGVDLFHTWKPAVTATPGGLDAIVHLTLTTMLEEVVLAEKRGVVYNLFEGISTEERLLSSARKAAELTPTCIATQVRYADVFSHGPMFNLIEAEEQYKYCLRKWPNKSRVSHKAGKFYSQHAGDIKLGIRLLRKGIELDQDNFPCWADYLRYKTQIVETPEEWDALISMLDSGIANFERNEKRVFQLKLLHAKGTILWHLQRKSEAINCLIEVFENELKLGSVSLMHEMKSSKMLKIRVNFGELLQALEEFKTKDAIGAEESRMETINRLTDALKRQTENEVNRDGAGRRQRSHVTSAADVDNNWRSGNGIRREDQLQERGVKQNQNVNRNSLAGLRVQVMTSERKRKRTLRCFPVPAIRSSNRRLAASDLDDNWRN